MAQQALGAGTTVPRKRALFGALDADGWAWAGVKATFWLVVIIMMLGYIPDRAYYLTVNRTVELGVLVWSPINFCSPENETLPCPAPVGAVAPWHPSPAELALPAAAHGRRRGPARHQVPVHRRDRTATARAVDRVRRADRRARATSTSGRRARRCPSRAPTRASCSCPAAST